MDLYRIIDNIEGTVYGDDKVIGDVITPIPLTLHLRLYHVDDVSDDE